MKDIPIIFSAPMIRALLDGRKTMTRRLAWRWPKSFGDSRPIVGSVKECGEPSPWQRVKPGDRLWVKETWMQPFAMTNRQATDKSAGFIYRADGPEYCSPAVRDHQIGGDGKWKSSLFCARVASRLTLIVTATKVERVQNITEADALAEGIERNEFKNWTDYDPKGRIEDFTRSDKFEGWVSAVNSFASLWHSLYGVASWDANPEVVALAFTVHKTNIDAMPKAQAA